MRSSVKSKGFSLLELMIVVAILGIISAVAYPSYVEYVLESRRGDAHKALLMVMQAEERFYNNSGTYSYTTTLGGAAGTGLQLDVVGGAFQTEDATYNITAAACGAGIAQCVQLTATAIGDQAEDTDCATITYQSTGTKGGTSGLNCW